MSHGAPEIEFLSTSECYLGQMGLGASYGGFLVKFRILGINFCLCPFNVKITLSFHHFVNQNSLSILQKILDTKK